MPRRKKKGRDMPPLDFVESPLYQETPPPDHDFCEIGNPASARVVAVDELENISWISPQFRRQMLHRVSRTRMISKSSTRLRSKSEGSPTDYLHSNVKSKFPPLQFLDWRSKSARSSDFEGQSAINLKHCSSYENLSNKSTQRFTNSLFNTKSKEKEPLLKNIPNVINSEVGTYQFQGCENSPPHENDEEINAAFPIPANTETCDTQNRNHLDPIGRSDSMDKKCQNCGQIQLISQQSTSSLTTTNCVLCGNGSQVLYHSTPINVQTNRGLPNGWDLCTPPHHSSRHVPILAPDTPECDYGLSMRQRQLKYFSYSSKAGKR